MSYVVDELRRLRKENVRLHQKTARSRISGLVKERDPEKRQVRLDLGTDPDSGRTVLSPWLRVRSGGAGAFKSFVLPSEGEPMYMVSASGVIGADSVAEHGTFTDQNPPPQQDPDELVIFEHGNVRFSATKDGMTHKVGDVAHALTKDGLAVTGGKLKHNDRNIGSDHKHGQVKSGGDDTGPPEA